MIINLAKQFETNARRQMLYRDVKQMLYRDRAKKFPYIPKTLDEYDSSLGITKLEDGGIYFFVYLFLKIGKKCGNSGGSGGIAPW